MDIGRINPASTAPGPLDAVYNQNTARSPEQVAEERQLIRAVKALNGSELFGQESELTFVLDRQTHKALVRVIDKETKEVVMQIPPEYVLRMAEEKKQGE